MIWRIFRPTKKVIFFIISNTVPTFFCIQFFCHPLIQHENKKVYRIFSDAPPPIRNMRKSVHPETTVGTVESSL